MKPAPQRKAGGRILRRFFLSGLVIIVPLAVTGYILLLLFTTLDGMIHPLIGRVFPVWFPGLGIVATALVVLLVGAVTHNFVARKLIGIGERVVARIPLAGGMYCAVKRIISGVAEENPETPKRVVLVPYPSEPLYAIGILNGEVSFSDGKRFGLVLMLSSLNPTTGILTLVPSEKIQIAEIPVDEAMTLVISGGMVSPKNISSRPLGQAKGL